MPWSLQEWYEQEHVILIQYTNLEYLWIVLTLIYIRGFYHKEILLNK